MKTKIMLSVLVCSGIGLVQGCSETDTARSTSAIADPEAGSTTGNQPGGDNPASPDTQSGSDAKEAESDDVAIQIRSWEDTQKLVASHQGKVVVLDLWSTSCEPCMREFPNLVALHNQFGRDQLVCISVSCDYQGFEGEPPESFRGGVLEFLKKQKASFENILLNIDSEALFEKIELASIPAVYVYGPDGKLSKRFDNESGGEEFTYQKDIYPLIEKLLAER